MSILWLGDDSSKKSSVVGNKAANISILYDEYNIPPGFIIPPLDHILIEDGEIVLPTEYSDRIRSSYLRLSEITGVKNVNVAVRSSALDEDAQGSSFAGQHDTYLNIRGEEEVAYAVSKCLSSSYSRHALSYREQFNITSREQTMPVLVQKMIESDVSAVVFSNNPINGNSREVYINSTFGLGQSLVDGTVNPDTHIIDKSSSSIISRHISRKTVSTILNLKGTEEVGLSTEMQNKPSIDQTQALTLSNLAINLERKMGWPVDLELAYKDTILYLLQCRPIST
mgnify:CR=1 FL=1